MKELYSRKWKGLKKLFNAIIVAASGVCKHWVSYFSLSMGDKYHRRHVAPRILQQRICTQILSPSRSSHVTEYGLVSRV
jgi:hypothetical protein